MKKTKTVENLKRFFEFFDFFFKRFVLCGGVVHFIILRISYIYLPNCLKVVFNLSVPEYILTF